MANRSTGSRGGRTGTTLSREQKAAIEAQRRTDAAYSASLPPRNLSRRELRAWQRTQNTASRQAGRSDRTAYRQESGNLKQEGKALSGYWSPESVYYRQESMQSLYGSIPSWMSGAAGVVNAARQPRFNADGTPADFDTSAGQDTVNTGGELVALPGGVDAYGEPVAPRQSGGSGLLLGLLALGFFAFTS